MCVCVRVRVAGTQTFTYTHTCTPAQHTLTQKRISTRIRMHTREIEGRTNRETNKKQEGKGERLCVEKTKRERYGNAPRKKTYLFSSLYPLPS
jgi:hypothetical protein